MSFTITYTGDPFRIDDQKFADFVASGEHYVPCDTDESPGNALANLFDLAQNAGVIVAPDGVIGECYGDDEIESSGFTMVAYPTGAVHPRVGVTCGWRDADNVWIGEADDVEGNDWRVVRGALDFMIAELNAALGAQ